jgi:hypothetical protein
MHTRRSLIRIAAAGLFCLGPVARVSADLFDDDAKITSGDIKDISYWRLKWTMDRLEEAIKSRQPQGRIGVEVGSAMRSADDLIKMYPNHTGLKKWKERLAEVDGKIDPNANRQESFRQGCLWAEGNYELAWASFGAAKVAMKEKNWEDARGWLRQGLQNLSFLQDRLNKQDRVANWPPEFITWIKETKPEAEKLRDEVAGHLK